MKYLAALALTACATFSEVPANSGKQTEENEQYWHRGTRICESWWWDTSGFQGLAQYIRAGGEQTLHSKYSVTKCTQSNVILTVIACLD